MLRWAAVLLSMAPIALAATRPVRPGGSLAHGESLFLDAEFKKAAQVFERAVAVAPDNARLHFWLGKSYERLAGVSNIFSARQNAKKAQRHLEAAVRLDPGNAEFAIELVEFYFDSPEWFGRGLDRAAVLLEQISTWDGRHETLSRLLASSRNEHKGSQWAMDRGILRASAAVGCLALGK